MKTEKEYNYMPLSEPIPISDQVWPEGITPLVCTHTLAYNHERYIKECLDGILMQKTTFPVQVLIHDDCSTDSTAEILSEYQAKYPSLIKVYYQPENVYSLKDPAEKARRKAIFNSWMIGKYIAFCEGDDYWTDPLKLQNQIEYMEVHSDVSFTVHRFHILNEYQGITDVDSAFSPKIFSKRVDKRTGVMEIDRKTDFHLDWVTQIVTTIFRTNEYMEAMREGYEFAYYRDVHLYYILLMRGKGVCLPMDGAVYRKNSNSTHIGASSAKRSLIGMTIYEELFLYSKDVLFLYPHFRSSVSLLRTGYSNNAKQSLSRLYPRYLLYLIAGLFKRFFLIFR